MVWQASYIKILRVCNINLMRSIPMLNKCKRLLTMKKRARLHRDISSLASLCTRRMLIPQFWIPPIQESAWAPPWADLATGTPHHPQPDRLHPTQTRSSYLCSLFALFSSTSASYLEELIQFHPPQKPRRWRCWRICAGSQASSSSSPAIPKTTSHCPALN